MMSTMKNIANRGLILGFIFTVISVLLTFTFVVPIYTIIPAALLEQALTSLLPSLDGAAIVLLTIGVLTLLFVLILVISLRWVKMEASKNNRLGTLEISMIFMFFYFVVHALGFYLNLAIHLNFYFDAQYLFDVVYTFPFSSLSFIILGLIIDQYSKYNFKTNNK